jgi:hypothetical protein
LSAGDSRITARAMLVKNSHGCTPDPIHAANERAAHFAFGRDDFLGLRDDYSASARGTITTPSRSPSR